METIKEIPYYYVLKMHDPILVPPKTRDEVYTIEWYEIGPQLPPQPEGENTEVTK